MATAVVTGAARGMGREVAIRLARRGYDVLVTDVNEAGAQETADAIGERAWAMAQDVRDVASHRAVAQAAAERGPVEVWVNNAGVMRTVKCWEQPDDEVRLECEVNLMGVIWGSRAAVDAIRASGARNAHIVNLASMSALLPVPGLAVYAATKHAVLGFTTSLQGDLYDAGIPITVHAVCPDGADTQLVRQHDEEEEAAIIWSGGGLLSVDEVADHVVGLLDGKRLVHVIPRWRGWAARANAMSGRVGLRAAPLLRRVGARARAKAG